ncbi:MAG: 50S ribosomal protein L3 [PVC group bacterium]
MAGLLGRKIGMTQVFAPNGDVVPVTVIQAGPCTVLEVLAGKSALKIGFEEIREDRLKKPQQGYFKKIDRAPRRYVREVVFADAAGYQAGQELTTGLFKAGDYVDVTGRSKGHGFTGMVKRWKASRFPVSHGHPKQRLPGSQGSSATPGHVYKGKHLPGRSGGVQRTIQSLEVVQVRPEENLIMLKGAVPGARSGLLLVRTSKKRAEK